MKNCLAYNLKYLRKQYHLTQTQLGDIIGKSGDAVSRWEAEQREISQKDLNCLCNYFGLEPADLMYRKLDEQTKSIFNETELELMSICKMLNESQLKALVEVAKIMVK